MYATDGVGAPLFGEGALVLVEHQPLAPVLIRDVDPLLEAIEACAPSSGVARHARLSADLHVDLRHGDLVLVECGLHPLDEVGIGFRLDDVTELELDVVDAVHVHVHLRQIEHRQRPLRRRRCLRGIRIRSVLAEHQRHQRDARELGWRYLRRTAAAAATTRRRLGARGGRRALRESGQSRSGDPCGACRRRGQKISSIHGPLLVRAYAAGRHGPRERSQPVLSGCADYLRGALRVQTGSEKNGRARCAPYNVRSTAGIVSPIISTMRSSR
jgi:hypothetical protein